MIRCYVMFSGGLDSVCATHILMNQPGLEVRALHFVLPFSSGINWVPRDVCMYADHLGVPLDIVEEGDEFLTMVKNPSFGYGKNANPCIDCRIHRLQKAAQIMEKAGASFLATGEVIGQRPMSQRLDALHSIENRAGLKGYLLRPLSAHGLPPTIPEQRGWVDRNRLLHITGRSRAVQLEYAKVHGLRHASVAGGCLLTQQRTADRFNDLRGRCPDFSLMEFKLLAYGRHFRVSPVSRCVTGRDEKDNLDMEKIVGTSLPRIVMADCEGPLSVVLGEYTNSDLDTAGAITARYSKEKNHAHARVQIFFPDGHSEIRSVSPADPAFCDSILL